MTDEQQQRIADLVTEQVLARIAQALAAYGADPLAKYPDLMTPDEVAEALSVKRRNIEYARTVGALSFTRVGKHLRFEKSEVRRYMNANANKFSRRQQTKP
jgi:excisionase family DNA binding protein